MRCEGSAFSSIRTVGQMGASSCNFQNRTKAILPMNTPAETDDTKAHPRTFALLCKLRDGDKGTIEDMEELYDHACQLERDLTEAKALVSERESRLANIKFLLEPIYGSTNYAPIGGTLDRVLNICDSFEVERDTDHTAKGGLPEV